MDMTSAQDGDVSAVNPSIPEPPTSPQHSAPFLVALSNDFDSGAMQKQYYSSAANFQGHPDSSSDNVMNQIVARKSRARACIDSIPVDTHDHFMHSFWTYYNAAWHMLSREVFNSERDSGQHEFYSPLLHLCILATGSRYADPSRLRQGDYCYLNYDSRLYQEARQIFESDMLTESSIPMMMSAFLIADLSGNRRRYSTGWFFSRKSLNKKSL